MALAAAKLDVRLKRAYAPPSTEDGLRILVDRLWPRGLRKESAAIDHWRKDAAPSTALRQWFGHEPQRWEDFCTRYRAEIAERPEALAELRRLARKGRITLLFAAHDELHNNAVVLSELLRAGPSTSDASIDGVDRTRRKS
jgi:uncharacterized protein YeaO (DUF488 family)